jgi:hypothetical protein
VRWGNGGEAAVWSMLVLILVRTLIGRVRTQFLRRG